MNDSFAKAPIPMIDVDAASKKKTLLVVEDDDGTLALLLATLEDQPEFDVVTARNGTNALRVAEAVNPDVVLLDVGIPGPNGLEVCQQLKQQPEKLAPRVVMLSAFAHSHDRLKGVSAGADAYLTKPVPPLTLRSFVKDMFAGDRCVPSVADKSFVA